MNPKSEFFELIRIEYSVLITLTSDSFGLRTSFGLIRIGSLGLSLIDSDWILVKIKNLGLTRIETDSFLTELHQIENFFRIDSNEFGLARKQISQWIGMNLIGSEWISIRNFYQGTVHQRSTICAVEDALIWNRNFY